MNQLAKNTLQKNGTFTDNHTICSRKYFALWCRDIEKFGHHIEDIQHSLPTTMPLTFAHTGDS